MRMMYVSTMKAAMPIMRQLQPDAVHGSPWRPKLTRTQEVVVCVCVCAITFQPTETKAAATLTIDATVAQPLQ